MKIFLIICLINFVVADQCINGINTISGCSCYSGFINKICNTTNNCNNWISLDPLQSGPAPILTGIFNNNTLTLNIEFPFITNRLNSIISLGNKQDCSYPGQNWNKYLGNCTDIFSSNIEWKTGMNCDWNITVMNGWSIYNNILKITVYDKFSSIRTTNYNMQIQVTFKNQVTMQSILIVDSPIKISALISYQSLISNNQGIIFITTTVSYPFIFINPIITIPKGFTGNIIENSNKCKKDEQCVQIWILTLNINNMCKFDGLYTFNFSVGCRDNTGFNPQYPNCPNVNNTIITANILSEDFCNIFSLNVGLSGIQESFYDSLMTIKRQNFRQKDRIYFLITLSTNNQVNIFSSVITQIYIIQNNITIFLFKDSAITPYAGKSGLNTFSGKNTCYFYFDIDSGIISTGQISVFTTVKVQFSNKEMLYELSNNQDAYTSSNIFVSGVNNSNTPIIILDLLNIVVFSSYTFIFIIMFVKHNIFLFVDKKNIFIIIIISIIYSLIFISINIINVIHDFLNINELYKASTSILIFSHLFLLAIFGLTIDTLCKYYKFHTEKIKRYITVAEVINIIMIILQIMNVLASIPLYIIYGNLSLLITISVSMFLTLITSIPLIILFIKIIDIMIKMNIKFSWSKRGEHQIFNSYIAIFIFLILKLISYSMLILLINDIPYIYYAFVMFNWLTILMIIFMFNPIQKMNVLGLF